MRVQGGDARGRSIKAPSSKDIRPTSQMVKEAIFDILGDRVKGCSFLDIFAGFGTVGTEAASRGAKRVVFADRSRHAVSTIRKNLEALGLSDRCETIAADARKAIAGKIEGQFDVIFADPPYAFDAYDEITRGIFERGLLARDGILIVEHYHKTDIDPSGFEKTRTKKYGQTALTFMQHDNRKDFNHEDGSLSGELRPHNNGAHEHNREIR